MRRFSRVSFVGVQRGAVVTKLNFWRVANALTWTPPLPTQCAKDHFRIEVHLRCPNKMSPGLAADNRMFRALRTHFTCKNNLALNLPPPCGKIHKMPSGDVFNLFTSEIFLKHLQMNNVPRWLPVHTFSLGGVFCACLWFLCVLCFVPKQQVHACKITFNKASPIVSFAFGVQARTGKRNGCVLYE